MSLPALTWAKRQRVGDPLAKLVLLCLAEHADDTGLSWPKQQTLAETCELPRETINRKLAHLEAGGFVTRELKTSHGMKTGCNYRLPLDVTHDHIDVTDDHTRCDPPSHADVTHDHIEPTNEPSLVNRNPPVVPPGFDEFWTVYPRKAAKGAARKAWAKAVALAPPETIIGAAERYRPPDPKFTKHPATWLNQECWTDEPDSEEPYDPFLAAMRDVVAGGQRGMDGRRPDPMGGAEDDQPSGAGGDGRGYPRLALVAGTR